MNLAKSRTSIRGVEIAGSKMPKATGYTVCSPLAVTIESVAIILLLIPPFFRTFIPQPNIVTLIITMISLLLLLAASQYQRKARSAKVKEGLAPLALLALLAFLIIVNNNRDVAMGGGFLWIVQFGGQLVAIVLLLACSPEGWPKAVFRAIAIFGLVYAVATIIFWIVPNAYDAVYPFLREKTESPITGRGYRAGLTTHYSTNGIYIALAFLASSSLALTGKRRFWKACSVVCFFALVLTTKRAHLAFGATSFFIAYFAFNSSKGLGAFGKFAAGASIALLAFYVLSFFNEDVLAVVERFQSLEGDDSFGGRSDFYSLCLSMWGDSPFIGNGWGSYTLEFNNTMKGLSYLARGFTTMNAHNVYLQLLAEEGLIGFILFVGAIATGLVLTFRALVGSGQIEEVANKQVQEHRALLAGSLSIQLFFAMYCMTGNPLYDAQIYIPWLFSIGVSVGLYGSSCLKQNAEEASSKTINTIDR